MNRFDSAVWCLLLSGCVVEALVHELGPSIAPVSEVRTWEHPEVATILMVEWTQDQDAEEAWLEVETVDSVHTTPPFQALAGVHTQAILGAPPGRPLELRIHNTIAGRQIKSEDTWRVVTGTAPEHLPRPELSFWDPALASGHPYLLLSVDTTDDSWYDGPYYVYILNRFAEVVWYHEVPDGQCTMLPRPSRDGTHLAFEQTTSHSRGDSGALTTFQRLTLDKDWSQLVYIPYMVSTWDEDDESNLYFDSLLLGSARTMDRLSPRGVREVMWNANESLGVSSGTATNTVRLSPDRGTFLWSMEQHSTVVEVDLDTGELVHVWGDLADGWRFEPADLGFSSPQYPGFTPEGHLLLTSHLPSNDYAQRVWELEVDEVDEVLRLAWEFGEDHPYDFASSAGGATRLDNGNTLVDYGTDGLVREVTPAGAVAWEMDWDADYLVGHAQFLDDLYALNQGW